MIIVRSSCPSNQKLFLSINNTKETAAPRPLRDPRRYRCSSAPGRLGPKVGRHWLDSMVTAARAAQTHTHTLSLSLLCACLDSLCWQFSVYISFPWPQPRLVPCMNRLPHGLKSRPEKRPWNVAAPNSDPTFQRLKHRCCCTSTSTVYVSLRAASQSASLQDAKSYWTTRQLQLLQDLGWRPSNQPVPSQTEQ